MQHRSKCQFQNTDFDPKPKETSYTSKTVPIVGGSSPTLGQHPVSSRPLVKAKAELIFVKGSNSRSALSGNGLLENKHVMRDVLCACKRSCHLTRSTAHICKSARELQVVGCCRLDMGAAEAGRGSVYCS
eukprot:1039766-Amphidinium_carterae.1